MIPIAPQEQEHEHGIPSDTPNEQLSQATPDLRTNIRRLEDQNRGELEDQGTVAGRPSEAAPESTHDHDLLGKDAQYTVGSGGSRGECRCPDTVLSINASQFRKGPGRIRRLRLPPPPLMSERSP